MQTLVQMSEQIRDHLIAQGVPAVSPDGACLYRGPGGTKCAVGIFIKDEHMTYTDSYGETKSVDGLGSIANMLVRDAVSKSLGLDIEYGSDLYNLLAEWQTYHDHEFAHFIGKPELVRVVRNPRLRAAISPTEFHTDIIKKLGVVVEPTVVECAE